MPSTPSSNGNANPRTGTARLQPRPSKPNVFPNSQHGHWHTRGYIPHFESPIAIQHITFRLADSLPTEVLQKIEFELSSLPPNQQSIERRKKIESWLDAGHGSCLLQKPPIAQIVQNSLLHFEKTRYALFAWTIMPNHVHVLLQPISPWTTAKIISSLKSWTGRQISELLRQESAGTEKLRTATLQRRPGSPGSARLQPRRHTIWFPEYWDRYIRNERHLQDAIDYIHQNPVKAGLTSTPEQWPWTSASQSRDREAPASPAPDHA